MKEIELQSLISAYRQNKFGDKEMLQVFKNLAETIFATPRFNDLNPKNLTNEAAVLCLEKLNKYDSTKGIAFNFFTTIIRCYFVQIKGLQKRLAQMEVSK